MTAPDGVLARRVFIARRLARGHFTLGRCAICAGRAVFVQLGPWLRDDFVCLGCWSIPRHRALFTVLSEVEPDWRGSRIHEFAPDGPASRRLSTEATDYDASNFWPDVPPGTFRGGVRSENLERLTFDDKSFDLVVSQDVFEHVLDPAAGFREVARVLRPGGAHLFTVPCRFDRPTVVRAEHGTGGVRRLAPAQYHGNPVDARGSLVVTDWGRELPEFIFRESGLVTTIHRVRDRRRGLDGAHLEVFESRRVR